MIWRWVIFDGEEVVGRVHTHAGKQMAELMARTVFPEANLSLKNYSEASEKHRKEAKLKTLVRPEICTRLWANPPDD